MSFNVYVVNEDQDPVSGVRVSIGFNQLGRGMADDVYTDSDGHASFSGYDDGEAEVFLDGTSYGDYDYRDGEGITLTQ